MRKQEKPNDGLKKSPVANFVQIRGNRYLHFFPPYILLLFIPVLVKHTRVGSNWVNGVCFLRASSHEQFFCAKFGLSKKKYAGVN